jgi:hypothetical protein
VNCIVTTPKNCAIVRRNAIIFYAVKTSDRFALVPALNSCKYDIFMNNAHDLVIAKPLVRCGINGQLEARAQARQHEVEDMKSSLKIVLSAVSVAALLASPALAKSHARAHHTAPSLANVPADARASAEAYGSSGPAQRVYSPNVYDPALHSGLTPDRQLGGER